MEVNKPCRIVMLSFIWNENPKQNGCDNSDIQNVINYCKYLIGEGFENEPMDNFNLKDFINWANNWVS